MNRFNVSVRNNAMYFEDTHRWIRGDERHPLIKLYLDDYDTMDELVRDLNAKVEAMDADPNPRHECGVKFSEHMNAGEVLARWEE